MTHDLRLLLIPIISAFIGWLFTKMYINRLLNKRERIAKELGSFSADLINLKSITDKIKDPEQLKAVSPVIEVHIDKFLRVKLQEKIPVIATFIGESTIGKLKEGMMEEINALLPEVLGKYADSIAGKLDIGKTVEEKINALTADKIQALLGNQIRSITIAGALLGLVIGLIQVLLTVI